MLKRRWPRPIFASTKIPASSGPRCVITSRIRSRTLWSTERPERDDKAIPLIPHINLWLILSVELQNVAAPGNLDFKSAPVLCLDLSYIGAHVGQKKYY